MDLIAIPLYFIVKYGIIYPCWFIGKTIQSAYNIYIIKKKKNANKKK